jgi:hypothetical protein
VSPLVDRDGEIEAHSRLGESSSHGSSESARTREIA